MRYSEKSIRSFVIRSGRFTRNQKDCWQRLRPKYCLDYQKLGVAAGAYWQPLLVGRRRLLCEIGFGTGSATWQIAQQNPDALYLGIEVYRSGVAALMQKAEEQKLENLRIVEHDALEVLEHMLAPEILDGLYLFFPDPWPKKRHHKRRLVRAETLRLFHCRLKPGACFHFVTDWQNYAEAVRRAVEAPLWDMTSPPTGRPPSRFEARASHEGHTCFELYLIKRPDFRKT